MILLVGCWGRLVTVSSLPTRNVRHHHETDCPGLRRFARHWLGIRCRYRPATNVIHDKTGFFVHLDVAKVLSSTDTYGQCGVVPAQLRYLDHQDREHVLDYQVQGTGCANDN